MIRTEYGQTTIGAIATAEVKADFCCIVTSIKEYFVEEEDMTKEQAKEEVFKMVERAFEYENKEEDNDKTDELMGLLEELLKTMKEGKKDE